MTWNYALGHRLLMWGKTSLAITGSENYKERVEKLLKSLQDISACMSIKVHFFYIAILGDFRIIAVM